MPLVILRDSRRTVWSGRKYSSQLLLVQIQAAVRPNNEVGQQHFFFYRPLGSRPLLDLLRGPTAIFEAMQLGLG